MSQDGGSQESERASTTHPNGRGDRSPAEEGGILAALPRTRPQRSSPRRAAANAQSAKRPAKGPTKPKRSPKPQGATPKSATPQSATRKSSASKSSPPPPRREPPAPNQGYESQEEPRLGSTVHPPSAVELVESVATIFAELASAGVKAGGRALKDALSPLHRR